ncbi:hypothetical protein O7634_15365 [Micromonospora sp. WMMD1120]|uniref:hypothetical protein n=1 Tax=Micromonospora sp. WMMD1120 TaxID=3016106 RepID=UPI0024177169|nr:hypothetical protein [Micromonospora sp. WMMD1120]MDG4808134.1 hypothetical protein [Micromonospora sp. WMMD1120]
MARPPSIRLRRRGVLGIPALVAAALTVVARPAPASAAAARPAPADAAPKAPECLADLLKDA